MPNPVSWKYSPMHWPVALFALYTVYRYFTATIEYEARLELFRVLLYSLFYFTIVCNFYRSRDRSLLVGVLVVVGIAESLLAFYQFATKATTLFHVTRPEQYENRGGGTYINPNHLAGYLEMVLALLLARIVVMRSSRSIQKSALKKVFTSYAALILLAGLIATFSRGGWIATICGFLTFLMLKGWQTRSIWPRVIVGACGLILIAGIGLKLRPVRDYLTVSLKQQEEREELSRDPSMGSRIAMWKASGQMFMAHPLLGIGPGSWRWRHLEYRQPTMQFRPAHAHNDYLHLAAEYGLIGCVLVAGFLVAFFYHSARFLGPDNHSDERSFAMGTVVAIVMILVHSVVEFNMHIPANVLVLLSLVGMTGAMDDGQKRFRRVEMAWWQRILCAVVLLSITGAGLWFYSRTALAWRQASLGFDAKEGMDLKQAVEHYQRALQYDPKSPEVYARLGDIYSNYGKLPARPDGEEERKKMLDYASGLYSASLELNPYQSDVTIRLADVYDQMGDIDAALNAYNDALEKDPHNAFTFFRLGLFYKKHGDFTKAEEAFKKSEELNFWSDSSAKLNIEELKTNQ